MTPTLICSRALAARQRQKPEVKPQKYNMKILLKGPIQGSSKISMQIEYKRLPKKETSKRNRWLYTFGIQYYMMIVLLLLCIPNFIYGGEIHVRATTPKYSQLLSMNGQNNEIISPEADDDIFRPVIPKDPEFITRNVFTPSGKFHVFTPIESDLRATASQAHTNGAKQKQLPTVIPKVAEQQLFTTPHSQSKSDTINHHKEKHNHYHTTTRIHHKRKSASSVSKKDSRNKVQLENDLKSDLRSLEELLKEYVENFFEKGQYEPLPGLIVELQANASDSRGNHLQQENHRKMRQLFPTDAKIHLDMPRTLATGRLLFLTGLKKMLWPVFMGLQVLKSLLIAMFIPALIGSFTKLLGKGISQGSAPLFIRPMDPPQELDFRDTGLNLDDDNKFLVNDDGMKNVNGPYAYNQAEASQMQNQYVYNHITPATHPNTLTMTRLGMNERQHQQLMQDSYMNALQSITSASFKNSNSISGGSSSLSAPMVNKPPAPANMNTFQQFQKVPASSLLLSNYDPFYSPLLSRLDSVFAQLKLNSDNESCREKAICLMYAHPAKYAPYSNLVSAQLSRELNELRKPTSDNPDILRFFKYMRAAKDGQDGADCEKTFDKCEEFKDFENPAMVSTYLDINKLVQARKLS